LGDKTAIETAFAGLRPVMRLDIMGRLTSSYNQSRIVIRLMTPRGSGAQVPGSIVVEASERLGGEQARKDRRTAETAAAEPPEEPPGGH
jgi:hypothetical protein